MTVLELIRQLETCDPYADVLCVSGTGGRVVVSEVYEDYDNDTVIIS